MKRFIATRISENPLGSFCLAEDLDQALEVQQRLVKFIHAVASSGDFRLSNSVMAQAEALAKEFPL